MRTLKENFLNKIKTQPDIWFFIGFLLVFSFSLRKVLFYLPVERTFNEYTGIYIYVSDIFLIVTISLWLLNLLSYNLTTLSNYYNKKGLKYRIKAYIKQKKAVDKLGMTWVIHSLYWILPLFLVVWSFISISWSQDQAIALFRSIKLFELYLLYLYLIFRIVPSRNTKKCSTWNISLLRGRRGTFFKIIISLGVFQSIIAILQFFFQHSLGLRFLRESIISPNLPGVAKVILNGDRYIRAYGFMPHPNVLGGFLVFSIVITWLYLKLFHPKKQRNVPPQKTKKCSTWNISLLQDRRGTIPCYGTGVEQLKFNKEQEDVLINNDCSTWNNSSQLSLFKTRYFSLLNIFEKTFRYPYIFAKMCFSGRNPIKGMVIIQIVALLLTFSKSAILALIIASLYILWEERTFEEIRFNRSNCSTPKNRELFHVEHSRIISLALLIIIVSFFIFAKPDLNSIFTQSLEERLIYLNVSRGTILAHPILGIGAGQFVLSMPHFVENVLLAWQRQPIHNVYLLIWAEIGLIGLGLFLAWIVVLLGLYKNVPLRKFQKCSTPKNRELFHVEQFSATGQAWNNLVRGRRGTLPLETGDSILHNNNIYSSSNIILIYAKAIFLGFLFIMLFDHYLWDIWQGQMLFWLVVGIIAGINRKR